MGKIFDLDIKETVQSKSLYPSERRKKTDADTPVNELLLNEKSGEWVHLWQQYGGHEECFKSYLDEENMFSEFQSFYSDFLSCLLIIWNLN